MEVTYKDVAKVFTIKMARDYYSKLGIAVVVNDGKDVTFKIEKEGVKGGGSGIFKPS